MTDAPFKIGDLVYLEKHYKHDTENIDYSINLLLNEKLKVRDIKFNSKIYGNEEKEWVVYLENNNYGHPACKFKLWNKKEIQNNSEFKGGDWVVFEVNRCVGELKNYKTRAWDRDMVLQVEAITLNKCINPTMKSLKRYTHYNWSNASNNIKCFRKAKLEEIPVESLSNEEILEVCKQYYPIGTKFKSINQDRIIEITNSYFKWFGDIVLIDISSVKNKDSNWTIYNKTINKFAEIISTPNQEVKDDFVLPEKWCIKITEENKPLIQKYFVCNKPVGYDYTIGAYYGNKMGGNWTKENSKEITTEQFKKYVLGENLIVKTKVSDVDINTKVFKNSEEIYIPIITKQKKKIDYTINSVFTDIKVNLPEKPKKVVKPIVLEKFNLII